MKKQKFTMTHARFFLTAGALGVQLLCTAASAQAADAAQARTLSDVTVKADPDRPGALAGSAVSEQKRLDRVPGGTNLARPQDEARLATLKDALGYQPGVVIQEFFGATDQPRLNIRGSGIQSNPMNRGITLLQDGLPLNEADGSFVIGTLEPRDSALISVRRGGNAITPGATTLGGELDFQSLTGLDEGGHVRVEAGSFGRRAVQVAKGFQSGAWDAHLSASGDTFDGYRHHSDSERTALRANVGYRDGNVENRTYLSWTDLGFRIPGTVPKDRVYSDPKGVLGDGTTALDKANNYYLRNAHRDTQQLRLANRTVWGNDQLRHEAGLYAQSVDDEFNNNSWFTHTDGHTLGAQWLTTGQAASGALTWRLGAALCRSDLTRDLTSVNPANGTPLKRFGHYDLDASNRNLSAAAEWRWATDWTLVGDLKWSHAERNARNLDSGAVLDQAWSYTTPKVGVVWNLSPQTRAFANLSRSQEAPTYWEIVNGSVAAANPAQTTTELTRLGMQKATTLELGASGVLGAGGAAGGSASASGAPRWQATVYRSEVDDELIATTDANGTKVGTFNYRGGTRHQGVEAGVQGAWALGGGQALDYRTAWTYSDFRFKGGPYAGKQIAGVPKHLIEAELRWRVGNWRVGPNVRWLPQDTPTDHANTPGAAQDAYAIWGFKVDYRSGPWRYYLQLDNLSNKRYASSYAIRNSGTAAQPGYLPGNGRSVSAGLTYVF